MHKVIENMPKPVTKRVRNRGRIYPFPEMKVGDGFKESFNSSDPAVVERVVKKIRSAVASYRKTHPDFAYETRTVDASDTIEPVGAGICVRRVQAVASVTTLKVVHNDAKHNN